MGDVPGGAEAASRAPSPKDLGRCAVVELSERLGAALDMAARFESSAKTDVLHVPFSYFPDPVGGTEIYVAALVAALRAHGLDGGVAVPADGDPSYIHEGLPVFRFALPAGAPFWDPYQAPGGARRRSFPDVLTLP